MKRVLSFLLIFLPWPIRRLLLQACFGYRIHPTARVGLSLILVDHLEMEAHARIGHGTVCKGLEALEMKDSSHLGNLNWVTGFPQRGSGYFAHVLDRSPKLILHPHSAITNRHLIDATDQIEIGSFTTIAGFRSQLLTHSIDLEASRQDCAPISIGSRCFIGSACLILGGARLPDRCVLGAASLLRSAETEPLSLYAGVPARRIKSLHPDAKYFVRTEGHVH